MRKKYIVPEYKYIPTNGTMEMKEESAFFCSKMLYIDDVIDIFNNDLIYFQNNKGEQINNSTENSLMPITYNISENKSINHSFNKDKYSSNLSTNWKLDINIRTIFINHVFALFKYYRTFDGMKNNMTKYNSVDIAIREYINNNVYNRYELSEFNLYILYNDIRNNQGLINSNSFSLDALNGELIDNIETKKNKDILSVNFNQNNDTSRYNFKYYFDLSFVKI